MPPKRNPSGVDRAGPSGKQSERAGAPARKLNAYALGVLAAVLAAAGAGYLVRPGASHALSAHAQRALQNSRNFQGRRGPWGLIEYSRIAISMPIEYAPGDPDLEPTRWWFAGATRERVMSVLADAGLTAEQIRSIEQAGWVDSPEGVVVSPPDKVILEMSPQTRGRVYAALALNERNGSQATPEFVYPEYVDERFESSGLSDATTALIRRLLYPRKSWLLFSDANVVMATLQTPVERQHFNQTVHRRLTMMAQLIIDRGSDLDAMVAYWDFKGRSKGLRSLFESVSRIPGGGELDISHVLTPFARQHLYAFPDPSDNPEVLRRDCGWTALNFFNDEPDDHLSHPEYAAQVLQRDYERVGEPRFGDVVALVDDHEESVHLATYLADNLTFTKNGHNRTQPWMLMKLPELVEQYSINRIKNVDVWYFRRVH